MGTKHIGDLHEDIKDVTDQLTYKEKMRDRADMARNYKLCEQLTEEMRSLKRKKREYEEELRLWERKDSKSQWYQKGKKRRLSFKQALKSPSESGSEVE